MTPGTLIQFAAAMRDEFLAENPGAITRAAYDRIYPVDSRRSYWLRAIEEAVRSGEAIRRTVLDDLFRRDMPFYWHLVHDYPENESIHTPQYWTPEARALNRAT